MTAPIIKKMIVYTGSFHHSFNDCSDNLHLIIGFSSLNSSDLESEEFNDENAMKRKRGIPTLLLDASSHLGAKTCGMFRREIILFH